MKWILASKLKLNPEKEYIAKFNNRFVNNGGIHNGYFYPDSNLYPRINLKNSTLFILVHESEFPELVEKQ